MVVVGSERVVVGSEGVVVSKRVMVGENCSGR